MLYVNLETSTYFRIVPLQFNQLSFYSGNFQLFFFLLDESNRTNVEHVTWIDNRMECTPILLFMFVSQSHTFSLRFNAPYDVIKFSYFDWLPVRSWALIMLGGSVTYGQWSYAYFVIDFDFQFNIIWIALFQNKNKTVIPILWTVFSYCS